MDLMEKEFVEIFGPVKALGAPKKRAFFMPPAANCTACGIASTDSEENCLSCGAALPVNTRAVLNCLIEGIQADLMKQFPSGSPIYEPVGENAVSIMRLDSETVILESDLGICCLYTEHDIKEGGGIYAPLKSEFFLSNTLAQYIAGCYSQIVPVGDLYIRTPRTIH